MVFQELTEISGKLDVASESSWSGLRPCSWCWRPRKKKIKLPLHFWLVAPIRPLKVMQPLYCSVFFIKSSCGRCRQSALSHANRWAFEACSAADSVAYTSTAVHGPPTSLWREVASQLNSVRLSTHALSIAPHPSRPLSLPVRALLHQPKFATILSLEKKNISFVN